jgi:hypothetical protein
LIFSKNPGKAPPCPVPWLYGEVFVIEGIVDVSAFTESLS